MGLYCEVGYISVIEVSMSWTARDFFVGGCSICGKASYQCICVKGFNECSFLSQVETGSPPTNSELLHEIKLLKREISEIRRELSESV